MNKKESRYLFLIMVTIISACIETDICLPAFPDMMHYFAVSEETIQALLTWNFFGICISGPLYGPLSDAFGRKKPLLVALGLFLAGSIITLFAHSFETMLMGRLLQGIGSGGCFTLGTAIIFDAFQAEKAIQAVSRLNTTVPFVMAIAPLVGGYLNHLYGFRSNFVAIALLVSISLVITIFYFEESLPEEKRRPFERTKILRDFKKALTCLPFWQLTLVVCLVFSGYIGFLSTTAVLFVVEFGLDKHLLPLFQAALLASWLIASLACSTAQARWGTQGIKMIGTTLLVLGGVGFAAVALLFPVNPYPMTGMMTIYAFGANWAQGIYFPQSMELLPDIKGLTASLLTSLRLLLAAVIIGITSHFYNGTIYPLVFMVLGTISSILALVILFERAHKAEAPNMQTGQEQPT